MAARMTRPPVVVVVAPTQREAVNLAHELGYPPYGREVVLISRGAQVRGLSLTADDHVVWSNHWEGWRMSQLEDVDENLRIATMTSPEPVIADTWGFAA